MYKLNTIDKDGIRSVYLYNPHTSELSYEDGRPFFAETQHTDWTDAVAISPDSPGKKIRAPKRLKIQLGLGCNYSCSYCLQSSEVLKASASSTADVGIFLKTLDTWLEGEPKRIEWWGGEPFLYWHKLKILIPDIAKRFPNTKQTIITNGSMLTDEIIDFMDQYNIGMAVSHDGPGQAIRGPDPFDDPETGEMIRKLFRRLSPKNDITINAVLTPVSYDMSAVIDWFKNKLGDDCPTVFFEGVVHDYGGGDASFTPELLMDFQTKLTQQIIDGTALRSPKILMVIDDFIKSLSHRRPSKSVYQKCGMDRDDQMAVDLLGNVLTCQNIGADGDLKIGHVRSFDKIKLDTSWHWSKREECGACPVLQLCKGACMYQDGKQWESTCNAEFAFNLAILSGAMYFLTGSIIDTIDGHIIRPGSNPNEK